MLLTSSPGSFPGGLFCFWGEGGGFFCFSLANEEEIRILGVLLACLFGNFKCAGRETRNAS